MPRPLAFAIIVAIFVCAHSAAHAEFDIQFQIVNDAGQFTGEEVQILQTALAQVEGMWETVITGYQPGISVTSLPISVKADHTGLASASYSGVTNEEGFFVATSGFILINVNEIENFANWQGPGANGLNFVDELLAHETGHVLGIGTLWSSHPIYLTGSVRYTGAYGLAAYQNEFNPAATFVPVENAGNPGTRGAHWDQLMRSSSQEGNPGNPWALDPRVGVTDEFGRDRGLEIMTGAIDPDFLEPFISRFTVQSFRDMGYTVTEFEDANGDGAVDARDLSLWAANFGATGLQIDSVVYGDADRDRAVGGRDFLLWQRSLGLGAHFVPVPESGRMAVAAVALIAVRRRAYSRKSASR